MIFDFFLWLGVLGLGSVVKVMFGSIKEMVVRCR